MLGRSDQFCSVFALHFYSRDYCRAFKTFLSNYRFHDWRVEWERERKTIERARDPIADWMEGLIKFCWHSFLSVSDECRSASSQRTQCSLLARLKPAKRRISVFDIRLYRATAADTYSVLLTWTRFYALTHRRKNHLFLSRSLLKIAKDWIKNRWSEIEWNFISFSRNFLAQFWIKISFFSLAISHHHLCAVSAKTTWKGMGKMAKVLTAMAAFVGHSNVVYRVIGMDLRFRWNWRLHTHHTDECGWSMVAWHG